MYRTTIAVVLSLCLGVVPVSNSQDDGASTQKEKSSQDGFEKSRRASEAIVYPALPKQQPLAAATEPLGTISLRIRARWFTYDTRRRGPVDAGPAFDVESLDVFVAADGKVEVARLPGSPNGTDWIRLGRVEANQEGSIKQTEEFVRVRNRFPVSMTPDFVDRSQSKLRVVPETMKFNELNLRLVVADDDTDHIYTLSRYANSATANRPDSLSSDLRLIYTTSAGRVTYKRYSNDVDLIFPSAGLFWVHCYGRGYESVTVCRTGDLEEPPFFTLWKKKS